MAHRLCLLLAAALLPVLVPETALARSRYVPARQNVPNNATQSAPRLIAEFERQDAVLVGWEPEDQTVQQAILDIIRAAWVRLPVVMLVADEDEEQSVIAALIDSGIPRRAVRFVHLPTDTIWARDFGPMVLSGTSGQFHFIDAGYGDADRTSDDAVPAELARILGVHTVNAPLYLDGGNLLSNGAGLVLTSRATLDRNDDGQFGDHELETILQQYYGARELVVLEPLMGEPTGHVDMFATFVNRDTVLVGEYSRADDPVNAEILDRNAQQLSRVRTPDGPLQVIRIPMPPHDSVLWPSYTNVLFANGTLLLPVYPQLDPVGVARAIGIYRRLLPGWRIARIDCSSLIELGGAVHCVTMNLPRVPDLNQLPVQPMRQSGRTRIARGDWKPHWRWKLFSDPPDSLPMFSTRDEMDIEGFDANGFDSEGFNRRNIARGFPASAWQDPRPSPKGPRLLNRDGASFRTRWQPADEESNSRNTGGGPSFGTPFEKPASPEEPALLEEPASQLRWSLPRLPENRRQAEPLETDSESRRFRTVPAAAGLRRPPAERDSAGGEDDESTDQPMFGSRAAGRPVLPFE